MKRVRINIPFTDKVTKKDYVTNEEIDMTEERVAEIRSVGVNLISVLGDVDDPEEQKEPEKEPESDPEEQKEPEKEPESDPEEQKEPEKEPESDTEEQEEPKKPRTRKKKEE